MLTTDNSPGLNLKSKHFVPGHRRRCRLADCTEQGGEITLHASFHFAHSQPKKIFLDHHRMSILCFPLPRQFLHIFPSLLSTDCTMHKQLCKESRLKDSADMYTDSHKVDTHCPCCSSTLWNFSVAFGMNLSCSRVWHVFYQHTGILCPLPDWEHVKKRNRNGKQQIEERERKHCLMISRFSGP